MVDHVVQKPVHNTLMTIYCHREEKDQEKVVTPVLMACLDDITETCILYVYILNKIVFYFSTLLVRCSCQIYIYELD